MIIYETLLLQNPSSFLSPVYYQKSWEIDIPVILLQLNQILNSVKKQMAELVQMKSFIVIADVQKKEP